MVTVWLSQFATRRTLYHFLFFFNDTATTEIYTLSLHDALPIEHAGVLRPDVRLVVIEVNQGRQHGAHGFAGLANPRQRIGDLLLAAPLGLFACPGISRRRVDRILPPLLCLCDGVRVRLLRGRHRGRIVAARGPSCRSDAAEHDQGKAFHRGRPLRTQGVDEAVSGNRGDQAGRRAPLCCSSGRMRPVSKSMIQSCRYPERSDTNATWRLSGAQVGSSFRPKDVSCRTARVRTSSTKTCSVPPTSRWKATDWPSGDQSGALDEPVTP